MLLAADFTIGVELIMKYHFFNLHTIHKSSKSSSHSYGIHTLAVILFGLG